MGLCPQWNLAEWKDIIVEDIKICKYLPVPFDLLLKIREEIIKAELLVQWGSHISVSLFWAHTA